MSEVNGKTLDAALEAFKPFEQFCKAMLDGFAVVNTSGKIVKTNPLIAPMCGLTSKQILSAGSFDDVFQLSVGDRPLKISEILSAPNPTRFDEIEAHVGSGKALRLIIGCYPLMQGGVSVGAWLLLRDITAETQLQDKYKDKATKSITDPMTGLFNRAHFEEFMKNQEQSLVNLPTDSDHRNLSVVMCDIDHFKKINDRYGHPAGDYVIKNVAQILLKSVRKTDVVCRYGGEEFLIILPASPIAGAAVAAEKVRQAIESFPFNFEGQSIPVTMSFGVAQLLVAQELGKDAIARADAALYGSKQGGRNRVSLHVGGQIQPTNTLIFETSKAG